MADIPPKQESAPSKPAAIVDRFTGKLACHRFMIPFDVQTPVQGIDPKMVNIKVDAHMAHVNCIGVKCALWNDGRKECFDVSERAAQIKLAQVLEDIEGFQRMHSQEG